SSNVMIDLHIKPVVVQWSRTGNVVVRDTRILPVRTKQPRIVRRRVIAEDFCGKGRVYCQPTYCSWVELVARKRPAESLSKCRRTCHVVNICVVGVIDSNRFAAERIRIREIPLHLSTVGNRDRNGQCPALPQLFKVDKPEGLVSAIV